MAVFKTTNLDHTLIKFSDNPIDYWTIRDAVRGTQIFGGIGSGKSSGSGKMIAKSFLKNGFGGLVLCAKPDERKNWENYAKETGRTSDLIIFSEENQLEFNPLEYEMTRPGKGAGEVFNLTNLFMEIYKMGNRFASGGSSGESERYWDNALKRCLNRMLQLLKLADKEVSIRNMRRLLSSAPVQQEIEALSDLDDSQLLEWAEKKFCVSCVFQANEKVEDEEEYELVYDYFFREFANLPEKTKSIVVESFLGLAEPFTSGILKKHFSQKTNITPELTHEGKIIILDFPVKEYLASGVYAQGIFKLLWQQAAERRTPGKNLLPIFLWVDEAQLFLSDYDQIFQTTARSSVACTVFLSQNINNYYVSIGSDHAKPKADSLLGNLGTKIFHANNDSVTNQWAANTIGKTFQSKTTSNVGDKESVSVTEVLNHQIEPQEFTSLKSGSKINAFDVEGIVTVMGKKWSNGKNFIKAVFNQQTI